MQIQGLKLLLCQRCSSSSPPNLCEAELVGHEGATDGLGLSSHTVREPRVEVRWVFKPGRIPGRDAHMELENVWLWRIS